MLTTPKLSALYGPLQNAAFPLDRPEITIGREPSNDISIPDRLLSRRHCLITLSGNSCKLIDLNSANGSFINGQPVRERALSHGDLIRLGNTVFLFSIDPPEPGEAIATTNSVTFEDADLAAQTTLALRREDSRYLQVEELLTAGPVSERMVCEFRLMIRIGLEINSLVGVERLQQRLLELISTVVPAERGAILLNGIGGQELASFFGWTRAERNSEVHVSRTVVQRVMREGVALKCNNLSERSEFQEAPSLIGAGVQSILATPLAVGDRVFGVLYLDTSDAAAGFDAAHLELATAITNLASAALDGARRLEAITAENERLLKEKAFQQLLIGESEALQAVREFIAKVAPTRSTVLIQGESGVGKEVIARALHMLSPRAGRPFIPINCANLGDALLESELFGHEKGAFTGATTQKKGKLELADGGTVFLDEIGEMKHELQAKLLRVLQERECERVGGSRPIKLDIRLLAATNKDLEAAIKDGSFRADLFHRLNVLSVTLPPLRDRRADIDLLARFFLDQLVQETGKRIIGFSPAARACLQLYDWPGNVRELRNAIERAVVLNSTGQILPEDLPECISEAEVQDMSETPVSVDPHATEPVSIVTSCHYRDGVKAARKQIILQAFKQADGAHRQAAKLLGLHPNNLHREIRLLNLREAIKK